MHTLPDRLNDANDPENGPDRPEDGLPPFDPAAHDPGSTGSAEISRSKSETKTGPTRPARVAKTRPDDSPPGGDWQNIRVARRYLTKQRLGAGGMGEVYLAYDEHLRTNVVLKVPKRSLVSDETTVERFEREIRSLVKLSHPHIVKIHDVGRHGLIPFAVMQYLDGGGLDVRRPRSRSTGSFMPIGPAAAIGPWITQIGNALDFVHASGYLHRDVKPGNILFDTAGNAYLGDFGVAKFVSDSGDHGDAEDITDTGTAPGTGPYQAPEVLGGAPPTPAADQYALAITAFELICGRKPFVGQTKKQAVYSRLQKLAPAITAVHRGVPARMARVLGRALSRNPAERFSSCGAFAEELLASIPLGEAVAPPPAAATFACPCCNEPIEVDAHLTAEPFRCPHCSRLVMAHPGLLWLEAAGTDLPAARRRIAEMAAAVGPDLLLPCPACEAAVGIAQAVPLKKGVCPVCDSSLRLSADCRGIELLAPAGGPPAPVAPSSAPSIPEPAPQHSNPFSELEQIGRATGKPKSTMVRHRYEKKKQRQEEITTAIGLASIVFMGLVGYLVYTILLK